MSVEFILTVLTTCGIIFEAILLYVVVDSIWRHLR